MNESPKAQSLLDAAPAASGVLRGEAAAHLIRDELLCEIFAASAARTPDAPCLVTPERSWSYAEVEAEAERIARGLVAEGAKPGEVIGLWAPRGPELLIAQIAIADAACVHRVGDLDVGDLAVWVGASAAHRDAAFAACRWIIDAVKVRVPIWKHERYVEGDAAWLHPHQPGTE